MENAHKKVGWLLGLGILLIPIIFAWVTLCRGYSVLARSWSFAWLIFCVIFLFSMTPFEGEEDAQAEPLESESALGTLKLINKGFINVGQNACGASPHVGVNVHDLQPFEINGQYYIAVVVNRNGALCNGESTIKGGVHIYHWNETAGNFVFIQTFNVRYNRPTAVEFYVANGKHYLLVADSMDQNLNSEKSRVDLWNWDPNTQQFKQINAGFSSMGLKQSLPARGASDLKYYQGINNTYLLVVERGSLFSGYHINSHIYKVVSNGGYHIFDTYSLQAIPTQGAVGVEFFKSSNGVANIIFANRNNAESFNIPSTVWKLGQDNFWKQYAVPTDTKGAVSWVHFNADGQDYALVANSYQDAYVPYTVEYPASEVRSWQNDTGLDGALNEKVIANISNLMHLELVNGGSNEHYFFAGIKNSAGAIYYWNKAQGMLELDTKAEDIDIDYLRNYPDSVNTYGWKNMQIADEGGNIVHNFVFRLNQSNGFVEGVQVFEVSLNKRG